MQQAPDYSLFPNKEEWGTGDEAMDNKLSIAMKKVKDDLTLAHIQEFYRFGLSLKPRAYNPAFHTTIEFVTKAFLHNFDPVAYVDELMLKMKGEYESKVQIDFKLSDVELIKNELKSKKQYRYKGQIDFYLHQQEKAERNPFIRTSFLRSPIELHTKIIMKDFKAWLNGEKDETLFDDPFFRALRTPGQRLFIDNFAEVWYHEGQFFSLPLFS